MTEDEMVGQHHQLNEHEFEQSLGDGEAQGRLVCCSPWGHKESNTLFVINTHVKGHKQGILFLGVVPILRSTRCST